jgi:hypothetical protein
VQQLQLTRCSNPALLHRLKQLRSLDCGFLVCSLEQLQAAVAAIGPSLTELDMHVEAPLDGQLLSQRVTGLPMLPLTGLSLCDPVSIAQLGQWTGLTSLKLRLHEVPAGLVGERKHLTVLQSLMITNCCPCSGPYML